MPIITLASITSLSDVVGELPLPSAMPHTVSSSLLFHPRVAEEAVNLLNLRDDTLVSQLTQALSQTSSAHIDLKDQYAGSDSLGENLLHQNVPEVLKAILLKNPNVFKQPSATQPVWKSENSSINASADDMSCSNPMGVTNQRASVIMSDKGHHNSTNCDLLASPFCDIKPEQLVDNSFSQSQGQLNSSESIAINAGSSTMQHMPGPLPRSAHSESCFPKDNSQSQSCSMPLTTPKANLPSALAPGSSPAQASTAPSQVKLKEEPSLLSQDSKTSVNSIRNLNQPMKEPRVNLCRLTAEDLLASQKLKKEPVTPEPVSNNTSSRLSTRNKKTPIIESSSDSEDDEPISRTKYFKARDKEREIRRKKDKEERKKEDRDYIPEDSPTSRYSKRRRNSISESKDDNDDSFNKPKPPKLRKVERKLVPVLEKLSTEELMETNTYHRFNKSVEKVLDSVEDIEMGDMHDAEDETVPAEVLIPKYQLQDLCSEAAKLKTLGAMESVPSDKLIRLLSILEKNIRDGAKVSPLADPDDDEEERKLWMELAMERVMRAVDASLTALYILTSPNMHKRVYLEDVIDRVVLFAKYQLHNTVYPSFDPVYRIDQKGKDGFVGSARKKRSNAKEVREKSVLLLYTKLVEVISLLAELLSIQTLTDTAVLHASSMGISPFFVENINELQLSALKLVTNIFTKYEKHRKLLLDDILASMARLPSSKRSLRSYRLSSEEYIQMLTALVLQLIQCMVVLPKQLADKNSNSDPDVVIISKFKTARSTASNFLCIFLAKCSSKSEEIDYRPLFENFIQDLLTTVNKPEWPAAELMLSVLGKVLVSNFVNKSLEMPLRVASLDYLGVIAARLRKDAVVSQLKLSTIDQLIYDIRTEEMKTEDGVVKGEVPRVKDDEERTQFLQSVLLDFLAVRSQSDHSLNYARYFYLTLWYQDNAASTGTAPTPVKSSTKAKKEKKRKKRKYSSDEESSSSEEEDDEEIKKQKENGTIDGEDPLEVFKLKEARKKMLLEKINPFHNSINVKSGKNEVKTQILQTYIDYDSAELVSRYLAAKRPFSQSFDTYLKHIIKVLGESSVQIRTKAMKCLTAIVEVDPGVLALNEMQIGVKHSFLDQSTSVREAAVDLVGKFVLSRPELIDKYYEMVSARILDTGVSVRKRVIKILKDVCTECPDFPKIPEICVRMIRRINDEDSIRKLVMEVFSNMWFTPVRERPPAKDVLLRKVMNITDVVAACNRDLGMEWFEQLLTSLFKPKEDKDDSTKQILEPPKSLIQACKQIVDCLIDNVLTLDGCSSGSSQRLVACLLTLHLFAKIRPQLLVEHAITLQPYLSVKCQTQGDYQIISSVARTLELVVPLMEHPSETFLACLEEDSVKLMMKHDPSVIVSCVSCLGSIVNNVTKNFSLIRDCLLKYLTLLRQFKDVLERNPPNKDELVVKFCPFFRRSSFIVGLLLRHFDFTNKEVLGNELSPNLKDEIFEMLMYFLQNEHDSQLYTMKAIGSVCIRHHDLMLGPELKAYYHQVLEDPQGSEAMKAQILNNIEQYLQEEERRMILQDLEWAKLSKQENLKEMGDVSSGMASTIIQLYLKQILESFLHPSVKVRQAALQVIQLILAQGLVHPVQIVPYLICMSTDVDKTVSNSADRQLQEIERKYPGFIHMKSQSGIKLSYKFQKLLQGDEVVVRGFRTKENEMPSALNGFLFSILRTKPQRRAFALAILKQFDEQVKTSLSQMLYLADNMAYFPFQVQDEPLFIIHHIDIMISVTGTNLLQSFREALLPNPNAPQEKRIDPTTGQEVPVIDEDEDEDEESLLNRVPEDTSSLQESLTASQGCLLLLVLKQHLKALYGLSDAKISQYSPSESAKLYEKNVNRKSNSKFNPKGTLEKLRLGEPPPHLDENQRKALIRDYLEFKHLIMNLDPDDVDDDDLDKKPGSGSGASGCSSGYASYTVSEADKVDPGKQPQPPQQQVQGDVSKADPNQVAKEVESPVARIPKLIIKNNNVETKHSSHRSHKSKKSDRQKKHHHKRKKHKVRSSDEESDEGYSDPDFLI